MASLSPTASAAGTALEIPAGSQRDEPYRIDIQLDEHAAVGPTTVNVGAGARATIVERLFGGTSGAVYRLVTEIRAAERADVTYTVVHDGAAGARLESTRLSEAGRDARVAWNIALLGDAEIADELIARLGAPGAHAEIAALFFPTERQNVLLKTEVRHDEPATTSQTVVRSIAAGHGHGKYFGNIRIAKSAHGSDASLRDDTLLIGKHAKIDAIPALEIAANDVKAFHGATVGAIDEEHIFYLMSRGIERDAAERLIALGFFEPALVRFPDEALREELRGLLAAKLARARA